jgi:hypothetical protein
MRQLNVEFIETNVRAQRLNNTTCLSYNGVSDVKRKAENIICGLEQMKKQATAKEHVKIVLKFSMRSFLPSSLDIAVAGATTITPLFLNFDLAMINIL